MSAKVSLAALKRKLDTIAWERLPGLPAEDFTVDEVAALLSLYAADLRVARLEAHPRFNEYDDWAAERRRAEAARAQARAAFEEE